MRNAAKNFDILAISSTQLFYSSTKLLVWFS